MEITFLQETLQRLQVSGWRCETSLQETVRVVSSAVLQIKVSGSGGHVGLLGLMGKKGPGFWHGWLGDRKAPMGAGHGLEAAQLQAWLLRRSKNPSGLSAADFPLASSSRAQQKVQERWWHTRWAP